MDRPRRALLEDPEEEPDDSAVRYIARRSGGFAPSPDEPARPEPVRPERPVRGRRALPPDPDDDLDEDEDEDLDEDDEEEPEAELPAPDPVEEPQPDDAPADDAPADDEDDDHDDEPPPRPRRAWSEPSAPEPVAEPPIEPEPPAPLPPPRTTWTAQPEAQPESAAEPAPWTDPDQTRPIPVVVAPPPPVAPLSPQPASAANSPTTPIRVAAPAPAEPPPPASPESPSLLTKPPLPAPLASLSHPLDAIQIERLVKSYNGTLAVRNLSFTVAPGRITGFLGPNGAGKTTTLRILVGLVAPTTGSATFGRVAYADLPHPQQTVGCVLDANVHPHRSGRNHLRVLAPTAGATDRRVDELLDRVGLTNAARQPAGQYSLGMKQRLALAAALLGDPDYLILDEPANGLDPEGIRWLRGFLREFAASGRTVLISSHLLNEVQATADDIVVINQGRLLAQLPISDLNLGSGTVRARTSDNELAVRALSRIDAAVERGSDDQGVFLRVHSNEVTAVGTALFQAGVVVHELITERRDLEQEFFAMLEASA